MKKIIPIHPTHPGEIVLEELLKTNNITIEQLAKEINMPIIEVNSFLLKKVNFTSDFTALLAKYFGINVNFFYKLQNHYQISLLRLKRRVKKAEKRAKSSYRKRTWQ